MGYHIKLYQVHLPMNKNQTGHTVVISTDCGDSLKTTTTRSP